MRAISLLAVLALVPLSALAADLTFLDGKVWTNAKIISQEPTSLIVLHDGAVETVHAAQLTPECMIAMKLRLPTEEELAERAETERRQREEAEKRQQKLKQLETEQAEYAARVEQERKERERAVSEAAALKPPSQKTVRESSSVVPMDRWGNVTEIWIDGSLLSRIGKGAIAQGNGPPQSTSKRSDQGWIQGTVYIQPDNRLNATYRGAPINGRVVPAGDFHYTDSAGIVHVMTAYRLY